MSFETISEGLERQRAYSNHFFSPGDLSVREREEITKTFALSLHAEVSEIASAINFKDHRRTVLPVDRNKLLYKSVDAYRYILAILNLWDIDAQTFVEACKDKDLFLHRRHAETETPWDGQPVVVFDVDDVIAEFRSGFFAYLNNKWGIKADLNDRQYYSTSELQAAGLDSDTAFGTFISDGGFRELEVCQEAVDAMAQCRREGYWVQLLTARPAGNLKCFYDTHHWLNWMGIPYDRLAFSPEKYLWLTGQEFFSAGKLVCAIDDSSKHSAEFAKHGVRAVVPAKPYNEDVQGAQGITRIDLSSVGTQGLMDAIRGPLVP